MMRLLYTLLLILASPILLIGLYKKKEGKPTFGSRWKEHFGFTPPLNSQCSPIWIHAVSVGEVVAATEIIKSIKDRYPDEKILLTTTTSTGAQQAKNLGDLIEHRYMPIDFTWLIKRFLKIVKPKTMLIMETELWPNTLHCVSKMDIPVAVLNARLSERSYQRYRKIGSLFRSLIDNLELVLCQNQNDAQRFIGLGVPERKTKTTGSVKFDIKISDDIIEKGKDLRKTLGETRPVWIAASTHKGEDEKLLAAHKKLLKQLPDALLILVPRHPERFSQVADLVNSHSLQAVKRSDNITLSNETQVYIGDTMGEMLTLIGASDLCVMCGSFIGSKVGGHNVLEPAALGIPTITGPSYFNFQNIVDQLVSIDGCIVTQNTDSLVEELSTLFDNDSYRSSLGYNAKTYITHNQGAVDSTIHYIEKYLE